MPTTQRFARRSALVVTLVALISVGGSSTSWSAADPPPVPDPNPVAVTTRVPMPAANPIGWKRVFSDDFNGTRLDPAKWGPYSGQPGGDPGGWWSPSHVVVGDGMVSLLSYRDPKFGDRWVSGGMSSAFGLKQRYGKYNVRFRVDAAPGIAYVLLLWPSRETWPPEIDFAEDGGGTRRFSSATVHYNRADDQVSRSVEADFTKWHTIGVEWTPQRLRYTLDGEVWATVRGTFVPAIPMELDAQTQAGTCGDRFAPCPTAQTPPIVKMQIDWVVAWAPA